MKTIEIFTLKDISYVPSPRTCDSYTEAAAVCLENQGHNNGVNFQIQNEKNTTIRLNWLAINQQIRDNWLELVGNLSFGLKKRLFRPDFLKFISNSYGYSEEI